VADVADCPLQRLSAIVVKNIIIIIIIIIIMKYQTDSHGQPYCHIFDSVM